MIGHVRGATWVEFARLPVEQHTPATAAFFAVTRIGLEAVLIFFVLSGALVGGQLLARTKAGEFSIVDYAIDRATRILIPLIPACLLTYALNWMLGTPNSFGELLSNMTGFGGITAPVLKANAPLWSLTFEIWFYIFGGALAYMAATRRSLAAILVAIVSIEVFTIIGANFLLFWALGAATTLVIDISYRKAAFVAGLTLALAGMAASQLATASKSIDAVGYISQASAETVICSGICLMLPLMYAASTNSALHLLKGPAGFVGGMSYTLYLVHYPVLNALNVALPRANEITGLSVLYFLVRIAVCSAVALTFYAVFERQTPAVRRWLRSSASAESRKHAPARAEASAATRGRAI